MADEVKVSFGAVYLPSQELIAREIGKETFLIPIKDRIADLEGEFFKLDGRATLMWKKLGAGKSLRELIQELCREFDAPPEEIENDALELIAELLKRGLLVEASKDRTGPMQG
jgi:hypothetical protein